MRVHPLVRPLATVAALTLVATTASSPAGAAAGPALARAAAQAVTGDAALAATLDGIFTDASLTGALTSMQVRDAGTGAILYSRNADHRVLPASNEKLMTSAAALEVLGKDYVFHTRAGFTGMKKGKKVKGDIYLAGGGDPTMTYAEYDKIAAAVAKAGIRTVTGGLIADDTAFDQRPLGLDWSWEDETYADNAPISALTVAATDRYFDAGSIAIQTRPGAASGKAAGLSITPKNSYVKIVNNTRTAAAGTAESISAYRQHGTNTVVVTGSIPLGGAATDLVSVQSPTLLAAAVFRDALARHKVKITGKTVVKATPAHRQLVDHRSMPLEKLLVPFLKRSNNGHAEILTKAMGRRSVGTDGRWTDVNRPGDWPTGLGNAARALGRLGVETPKITMGDGSGLSRRNWLTTRQIATLLQHAQSRPWFAAWYAALPIAANPDPLIGGTLANRFTGQKCDSNGANCTKLAAAGNLHGKTGTLTGVNALSGYVTDAAGRHLIFSIISNNAAVSAVPVLDRAAEAVAEAGAAAGQAPTRQTRMSRHQPALRNGEEVECSWVLAC